MRGNYSSLCLSLISADERRVVFLSSGECSAQPSAEISGPPRTVAPPPVPAAAQGLHRGLTRAKLHATLGKGLAKQVILQQSFSKLRKSP